jgi:uncharacterized protein DUF6445
MAKRKIKDGQMFVTKAETEFAHSFRLVDGFYDDPDEIRNYATRCRYKKPLISSTPSLISDTRHPNTCETLTRIAALVNCKPDWKAAEELHTFWGQSGCGEFQLTLGHLNTIGQPHSHKNGQWVGIIYLNTPEQCQGRLGTYILRHNPTGLCHITQATEEQYERLKEDSDDQGKWTVIASPEMRYNRLFLFDSRYFHAMSAGFGDSPASGRLIQIFNFKSNDFRPAKTTRAFSPGKGFENANPRATRQNRGRVLAKRA